MYSLTKLLGIGNIIDNLSIYCCKLWRIEQASTQPRGKCTLIFRDDGFFNMQSAAAGATAGMVMAGRVSASGGRAE